MRPYDLGYKAGKANLTRDANPFAYVFDKPRNSYTNKDWWDWDYGWTVGRRSAMFDTSKSTQDEISCALKRLYKRLVTRHR